MWLWDPSDTKARTLSHMKWVLLQQLLESLETVQRIEKVRFLAVDRQLWRVPDAVSRGHQDHPEWLPYCFTHGLL